MTFPQAFNAVCAHYELSAESRAVALESCYHWSRTKGSKVLSKRAAGIYLALAATKPPYHADRSHD